MVSSCCAVDCTNRFVKGTGFFRFPSDPFRRRLWIKAVRRKNWMPSKTSVLCGVHFITGRPKKDEKHPDYVPSIFSYNSPQLINNKKRKFDIERISSEHNYNEYKASYKDATLKRGEAEVLQALMNTDKMRMCCVPLCKATSIDKKKVSYFRLPANLELRAAWIKAITEGGKHPAWKPTESSVVCNKHFRDSDISISTSRKRLLPNVVPSVFEHDDVNNLLKSLSERKLLLTTKSDDLDSEITFDDQPNSEMIYSCCVFNCKNRFQKGIDLKFFKFPTEPERESLWIHCLQQENWNSAERKIICGAHFQTGRPSSDPDHPDYVPNIFINPSDQVDSHSAEGKDDSDNLIVQMDIDIDGPSEYIIPNTEENFEKEETILEPGIVIKKEPEAFSIIKQIECDVQKELSYEMQKVVQSCEIRNYEDELLKLKEELKRARADIKVLIKTKDVLVDALSVACNSRNSLTNAVSQKEEELSKLKLELEKANAEIKILSEEKNSFVKELEFAHSKQKMLEYTTLLPSKVKLELEQAKADIKILSAEKDSFVKELESAHSKQKMLEYTISENEEKLVQVSKNQVKLEKDLKHAYAEIDALRKERDKFQEKLLVADVTKGILHDHNKLHFYTGFKSTKDFFSVLMRLYDFGKDFKTLSVETKFLIVLMRLKFNFSYEDLGYRFDTGMTTVYRLCEKTIPVLETRLEEVINNPVDDVSNSNLPAGPKITTYKDLLQKIRRYSKNVNKQITT